MVYSGAARASECSDPDHHHDRPIIALFSDQPAGGRVILRLAGIRFQLAAVDCATG